MTTQPPGSSTINVDPSSEQLYEHISSYPFHSDQEYLSGLAAIFGHPNTPATEEEIAQNQDLIIQAQCFYLARNHQLPRAIDVDGYRHWLLAKNHQYLQNGVEEPQTHAIGKSTTTTNGAAPSTQSQTISTPSTSGTSNANAPALANVPDPIDRPHAPTPTTAAAASVLDVQPHSQTTNTERPAEVANATSSQGPAPPYPTSFADIVDLITQNKPVPGIEEVPNTVLELGSSKRDTASRRKKPWEKDDIEWQELRVGDTGSNNDDADKSGDGNEDGGEKRAKTGQGVLKILQPGAVPDSGLVAGD